MTLNPRRILSVIMLLSVAGVVVSSVSLYHHYDNKSGSSFCDFGGSFNCDIVNRSIYSKVFDVPVALIGIVGDLALAILVAVCGRRKETIKPLLAASIAGLAFALHL